MNCLNEGMIQAYIDREIDAAEMSEVERHLAECAGCRSHMESATRDATSVRESLSMLGETGARVTDASVAYANFRKRAEEAAPSNAPWWSRVWAGSWTPAWGALAILGIALVVGFSPVRTWAERLLATLRVKRIAVIAIDPRSLSRAEENDPRSYKLLEKAISETVVFTKQPGNPQVVTDTSAAAQLAGFPIRRLQDLPGPQRVQVNGEVEFHMTLDRDRLANLLDEIGRPEIAIPDSADGATLSVHIPKTVFSMYGECKDHYARRSRGNENETNEVPSDPGFSSHCTLLVQAPSPTLTVPPNLNMSDIAEAGLQLAGMGAGEAHALCSTVDWTSTLVIPVPRDSASYRPVFVDGVEGTLIEMERQQNRYSLLWTKNGVIYSLNGNGTMNDALALAASLR